MFPLTESPTRSPSLSPTNTPITPGTYPINIIDPRFTSPPATSRPTDAPTNKASLCGSAEIVHCLNGKEQGSYKTCAMVCGECHIEGCLVIVSMEGK